MPLQRVETLKRVEKGECKMKILTSEGVIWSFDYDVYPSVRKFFNINNNKVSVCFRNTGFGTDTNALCFGWRGVEYGNLSSHKVKACMQEILNKGVLDLSDVKVIYSIDDIAVESGEEYLFMDETANNNVFNLKLEKPYCETCMEDKSEDLADDKDDQEDSLEYEELCEVNEDWE